MNRGRWSQYDDEAPHGYFELGLYILAFVILIPLIVFSMALDKLRGIEEHEG